MAVTMESGVAEPVDSGGLFYMVVGLFILAVYVEFKPKVNEAENKYLKDLVKKELQIVICSPVILLLAMGVIKFLSFGVAPPYWLLIFYFFFTFWYYPGYLNLNARPRAGEITDGVSYSVIRKAVVIGYLFCHASLSLIFFGIFGPFQFDLLGQPDYPPPNALYMINKNGEVVMINMAHGYLTSLLYHNSPSWFLFIVMFYVSQFEYTASFRLSVYLANWLFDGIAEVVRYLME